MVYDGRTQKSAESSPADVPLLTNPWNNSSLHGLTESREGRRGGEERKGGRVSSQNHVSWADSISYTEKSNLSVLLKAPAVKKQHVSLRLPNVTRLGNNAHPKATPVRKSRAFLFFFSSPPQKNFAALSRPGHSPRGRYGSVSLAGPVDGPG